MEQLLLQILSNPGIPAALKLTIIFLLPPAVAVFASTKTTIFFYRTMNRIGKLEEKFDNGINKKLSSMDGKLDQHGDRITALEATCKARHGGRP